MSFREIGELQGISVNVMEGHVAKGDLGCGDWRAILLTAQSTVAIVIVILPETDLFARKGIIV
jgi:hypothetical protein